MSADEPPADPDVARLFAPVAVEETFAGVLTEATGILGQIDDPVDAELWGSDLIGALASSAAGQASLMEALTGSLVPAAEAAAHPGIPGPAARLRRARLARLAGRRRAGRGPGLGPRRGRPALGRHARFPAGR